MKQRPVEKLRVMNGATVSELCLISRDSTGSRAQAFPSDFLRRPTNSSVVTEENETIVVDAVGTMSGSLALDVSARRCPATHSSHNKYQQILYIWL